MKRCDVSATAIFGMLRLYHSQAPCEGGQQAPNPPKFAQPDVSRSKGRSPAKGYKIGCFSYMNVFTPCESANSGVFHLSHVDLLKWGCANFGMAGARWGRGWAVLYLKTAQNSSTTFWKVVSHYLQEDCHCFREVNHDHPGQNDTPIR